jgi:hypothetical protein
MKKRPFALDFCTPSPPQRLIRGRSSLCGNGRLGQFVEQRLGHFEVGGIEAFGKPAEDRASSAAASCGRPCCWRRRAMLIVARNSQDFAVCRRATSMPCSMAVSASLTISALASNASPLSRQSSASSAPSMLP